MAGLASESRRITRCCNNYFLLKHPKTMTGGLQEYIQELIVSHSLDCYVIFNSDRHLSEYIGEQDQRVRLISGFTGSNGTVVVCKEPCLITDSRYYIQAEKESKFPLCKTRLSEYIISKGYRRISFDTNTISSKKFELLMRTLSAESIEFVETEFKYQIGERTTTSPVINLEDYTLLEFMRYPGDSRTGECNPTIKKYLQSLGFSNFSGMLAGVPYGDKLRRIRELAQGRTVVITELDTVAWTLNLRGTDIEYNPVFYSFLVVSPGRVVLFCDKSIVLEGVEVQKYTDFDEYVAGLWDTPVLVSGDCTQALISQFRSVETTNEIRRMQATKNETELCGMALAYFFDGLALTELFSTAESSGNSTEEGLAATLDRIKRRFPGYLQPSFDTISSTGANAAIVHHRATGDLVDKEKVYLIDSGSQYYFGTTDTTRTLFLGTEIDRQIRHDYTLVLKGQLSAMARRYPAGSKYSEIDAISRSFLKEEGKDYGHSTGHGVGHFLCVHEAPPNVHPESTAEIEAGLVFSIEPGFYKAGEYGIRIENLVISRRVEDGTKLQNITIVPYQNEMVDVAMLSGEETRLYNEINKKCAETLQDFLSDEGRDFLRRHCGPI